MDRNLSLFHTLVALIFGVASQQPSDSYLMVLGGKGTQLRYVEVVSLDPESPLPQCLENMSDLPSNEEFDGSSGATLPDGIPLICGSSGTQCFRYQSESDTWLQSGFMRTYHKYAGYAHNSAMGLTIAGGLNTGPPVEMTFDGFTFSEVTPMSPNSNEHYFFCLVAVDDNTLMRVGGVYGMADKAYIYTTSANDWTEVAPMPQGRSGHSCGLVEGPNGKEVVVVGGTNIEGSLTDDVEIYSIHEDKWRRGTTFPSAIDHASSVQLDGTFMVVGGGNDLIYEYDTSTEDWKLLLVTLSEPRMFHTALMVPASIFPQCDL